MRILVCLLVSLWSAALLAAPGYLLLPAHPNVAERDGAQPAQLFVYDAAGDVVHSGVGGGQFEAGAYVELEEGWYFAEVGRFRNPANAWKFYVAAEHVTVVPSGWVFVQAVPLSQQTATNCSQWNAELNAFVMGADGIEVLTISNRGSGVQEWGAVQLMAGEQVVYFNGIPARLQVPADTLVELSTGFQDPVYGNRPTLSTRPEGDDTGLRVPLCDTSPRQVPVGEYWASAAVPTETYPYERREWTQVEVQSEDDPTSQRLSTERLEHERFEGEGATPLPLTEAERAALTSGGAGGGVRLRGFGR